MLEKIRDYVATCPFIEEFAEINANYLSNEVKNYSVIETASYNPVLEQYDNGDVEKQFLFSLDAKLSWNSEVENNISNSNFFEKFSKWLKDNYDNDIYPQLSENVLPISIEATSNGYIFIAETNEAIYRISCKFTYLEMKG